MWPWKLQLTFAIWQPFVTLWSKRNLSSEMVSEAFFWVNEDYFEWEGFGGPLFWMGWSGWGCMGYYFGWVEVSGSGWENILGKWGWMWGKWGWVWMRVLFDHAQTVKQTQKIVAPKKLHINKVMNTQLWTNVPMNSTLKMANERKPCHWETTFQIWSQQRSKSITVQISHFENIFDSE